MLPIKILSISTKSVSDNYLLESEHNGYIRVVSPYDNIIVSRLTFLFNKTLEHTVL
jgi:hypothetical protein